MQMHAASVVRGLLVRLAPASRCKIAPDFSAQRLCMLVMVLWQRFWESMRCRVPDLAKICASHDSSRVDEAATQMQALDQPQENTGDLLSKLTSGAHHQSLDALMAPQGSHLGMYEIGRAHV